MGISGRSMAGTLILMVVLLAILAAIAHARGGSELLGQALKGGGGMLLRYAPVIAISFLAAGFAEVLIPSAWVRDTLGADSGMRGVLIATGAGAITPAGPFVSMPIAVVMLRSGAAAGPVVAYLTAWSVISLHRMVAWEVPILGWQFAALRYLASLLLPLVAGLLAGALARSFAGALR
jgi:uncharacterized membrane protein YraQ (UPF0718 family)